MTHGGRHFLSLLAVAGAITVPLLIAGLHADVVERSGRLSATEVAAMAPRIAPRVERIRELNFKQDPQVDIATVDYLRRTTERELEKARQREDLDAEVEVLALLGLLEPHDTLNEIVSNSVDVVSGFYDPRTKELSVVESKELENRTTVEMTIAHELTHALEDQRFGLRRLDRLDGDEQTAVDALVEGSATHAMFEYALRYQDFSDLLDLALDEELTESASTSELPDVIEAQIVFPYLRGQAFVERLVELGDDWDLVDIAYRGRLPLSTEQILHPEKYLTYERPSHPPLDLEPTLGPEWQRLTEDTLGEFDTIQILRAGAGDAAARRAAAGWAGARYEIWRRGPADRCDDDPCRSREVLAISWNWDSAADARKFAETVPAYLEEALDSTPAGEGRWALGGSAIRLLPGSTTTLLFAPAPVADRLAGQLP